MRKLIEFYDRCHADNLAALLKGKYDEVVYFCLSDKLPDKHEASALFTVIKKHFGVKARLMSVHSRDMVALAENFAAEAGEADECDIDLTGGSGLFIAAAGYCCHANRGGNIRLIAFDTVDGKLLFSSDDSYREEERTPLSFRETVEMNGGSVISVADGNCYDFSNTALRSEIIRLWDATRSIPTEWNRFCSLPHEDRSGDHKHPRIVRVLKKDGDRVTVERVMTELKKKKVVYSYEFIREKSREIVSYELYRSAKTKTLYEKSGTALEMYACLAATECGVFHDCNTGVILDLDGNVTNSPADPKNEIDLTAMLGNTPVFVSCKNTAPMKEYLYEVQELARYFGGDRAIAALACTPVASAPVKERARQMGVILIDDVFRLTLSGFRDKLIKEFQPTDQ